MNPSIPRFHFFVLINASNGIARPKNGEIMRTTKRFTPKVLDRFRAQRRGIGVLNNYRPWHGVSRGDPASMGRSHLPTWQGRQTDLLSDKELVGFLFSTMIPSVIDIREQYPLSLETAKHELSAYDVRYGNYFESTLELARRLGIKHPMTHGDGRSESWVMSTDLLLTMRYPGQRLRLLAVALKLAKDINKKRTRQLLHLERAYWSIRGVEWLLITPNDYDPQVVLRLREAQPWGLGDPVDNALIELAAAIATDLQGSALLTIWHTIGVVLGDFELAQRAFWQGVWRGSILLNLKRGWRPHEPARLLSREEFLELNPIASRRSSWI